MATQLPPGHVVCHSTHKVHNTVVRCEVVVVGEPQRETLAAFVVRNHLALSHDDAGEWLAQLKDVPADFAHLLDPAQFADGTYLAARDTTTGHLYGCCGIAPLPTGAWELRAVSVDPRYRRCGIARSLVQLALRIAEEHGAPAVQLVTLKERMAAAVRLYATLGFAVQGETVVRAAPCMTVLTMARSSPTQLP